MNYSAAEIEQLKNRISVLETENSRLKKLLDEAGIDYAVKSYPTYDQINQQLARKFFSYFWGRTDVFSKRYVSKASGKAGYFPQCDNLWVHGICPKANGEKTKCMDCENRKWTVLKSRHIEDHLRGNKEDASDVIGVYPLFPDGTCRFLVFDFDDHENIEKQSHVFKTTESI